ncbi:MAG: hypothetical protein FWG30_08680 [Eubacteriaceae bacterium]|nr:hypothetical protein [Eubacteriaceae bacterium]
MAREKKYLAIAIAAMLALCSCTASNSNKQNNGDTGNKDGSGNNEDKPYAALSDIRQSCAWAVSNSDFSALAAVEYANGTDFEKLSIAVCTSGIARIEYAGEKEAIGENSLYYSTYEGVTGPSWNVASKEGVEQSFSFFLLDGAIEESVFGIESGHSLERERDDYSSHGHLPASDEDIQVAIQLKGGRQVKHSELLGTLSDGGRISVFQYENTDYAMIVLAYINGEKVVYKDFYSNVFNGTAFWRADAESEDICMFDIVAAVNTDEGLMIALQWSGPEGAMRYILVENNGKFAEFMDDYWSHDVWEDKFNRYDGEILDSAVWPDLDANALLGTWAGEWEGLNDDMLKMSFTFNADGTGAEYIFQESSPFTYRLEGNMFLYGREGDPNVDFLNAKIDGDKLIIQYYPVLIKQP